jgi:hypothetical protein
VRPKAFLPEVVVEAPQRPRRPLYGVAHFECSCGNEFTSRAKRAKGFNCPCYQCDSRVRPAGFLPPDKGLKNRKSNQTHNCSVCNGSGHCPVARAAGGGARR